MLHCEAANLIWNLNA